MASLTEEIADALAQDVIRASQELGDENLVTEISKVIGASSTTTQEAFMTAVRVRLAEQRARRMLAERMGEEWVAALEHERAPAPPVTVPAVRAAPVRAAASAPAEPVRAAPAMAKPAAPAAPPSASAPPAAAPAPQAPAQRPAAQAPASVQAVAAQAKAAPASSAQAPAPAPPAAAAEPPAAAPSGPVPARPPKPEFQRIEAPVAAAPVGQTLAAKLSLAAALPRRNVETRETPADDPDIEIPDGDWG
jgi:hypothetical protein